MKYSIRVISLIVGLGTALSGLVWLLFYSMHFTVDIGFDGVAVGILAMTIVGGWFVTSAGALALYIRKNKNAKPIMALIAVIISGTVAGLGSGYAIASYALDRYGDRPDENGSYNCVMETMWMEPVDPATSGCPIDSRPPVSN